MHPFKTNRPREEDTQCPVCCESLSLRLAGEKPHIVPNCGHKLHEACFEAVYGGVDRARSKPGALGLCGVCRRDMQLGGDEEGSGRKNKFAALSGTIPIGQVAGMNTTGTAPNRRVEPHEAFHDPTLDDELVNIPLRAVTNRPPRESQYGRTSAQSSSSNGTLAHGRPESGETTGGRGPVPTLEVVRPVVTVRAEHDSVHRLEDRMKKQHLTCMVSIEMPSRYPAVVPSSTVDRNPNRGLESFTARPSMPRTHSDPYPPSSRPTPPRTPVATRQQSMSSIRSDPPADHRSSSRTPSPPFVYGATPPVALPPLRPFDGIVDDLKLRMADWKGHSPDEFGALRLYDYIRVRKERNVREFLVYLFEEAILCVTDDRRKPGDNGDRLRLKGRVYVRHIRSVVDTSTANDLSLTVAMSDDSLDEFIMTFNDRARLELWKAQIEALVALTRGGRPVLTVPPPSIPASAFGRKASGAPSFTAESIRSEYSDGSSRSGGGHLSSFSGYTRTTSSTALLSPAIKEEEILDLHIFNHRHDPPSPEDDSSPYTHAFALPPLDDRDFIPLDLTIILSLPSGPDSLKMGIIKSSLDFLIHSVGPSTRLCLVTFCTTGTETRGTLFKTPFIAVGKLEGKKRLGRLVEALGTGREGWGEHVEERVNVVTAVNLALDTILQRKSKSALTGMILMSDGRDGAQKQQMDLVMARAEAAAVPIHTIGWGRSHDPSSLWLLSNHTSGTYTFIKEFYDLRDTLAGILGSILSIACTNVKLHLSVPERRWFRIRKVAGTPGAVVSSTGKDVDISLGELRWGERRDILVEVEMVFGDAFSVGGEERREGRRSEGTATDAFFDQVGLSEDALDGFLPETFYEDEYAGLEDEVPVFEVNVAYRDPASGTQVNRLTPSPCLLTISLAPPMSDRERLVAPLVSAPDIVRRRMELLCSDMLVRTLLLMSRRNDAQAQRLLTETKRIISTILSTLNPQRRTSSITLARSTLLACSDDINSILEACKDRKMFEGEGRNLAAQQAVVLRNQKSFGERTATEGLFWRSDNSRWMVEKSRRWVGT